MSLLTNPALTDFQRKIIKKGIQKNETETPAWLDYSFLLMRGLIIIVTGGLLFKLFGEPTEHWDNLINFCIYLQVIITVISTAVMTLILTLILALNWMLADQCKDLMPWSDRWQERHKFMLSLLAFEKPKNYHYMVYRTFGIINLLSLAALGWTFTASLLTLALLLTIAFSATISSINYTYFTKLTPEMVASIEARRG